ncbi:hypothetical protein V6N11_067187 [Hibiscus sabdariffa]|uniref:Uncharacterized protein n=1 Tax=Hibiscus sabdariffa TaxID=183260 RepID=A0ABR2SQT9_9ROSI
MKVQTMNSSSYSIQPFPGRKSQEAIYLFDSKIRRGTKPVVVTCTANSNSCLMQVCLNRRAESHYIRVNSFDHHSNDQARDFCPFTGTAKPMCETIVDYAIQANVKKQQAFLAGKVVRSSCNHIRRGISLGGVEETTYGVQCSKEVYNLLAWLSWFAAENGGTSLVSDISRSFHCFT